jgi:hypothetical protein
MQRCGLRCQAEVLLIGVVPTAHASRDRATYTRHLTCRVLGQRRRQLGAAAGGNDPESWGGSRPIRSSRTLRQKSLLSPCLDGSRAAPFDHPHAKDDQQRDCGWSTACPTRCHRRPSPCAKPGLAIRPRLSSAHSRRTPSGSTSAIKVRSIARTRSQSPGP